MSDSAHCNCHLRRDGRLSPAQANPGAVQQFHQGTHCPNACGLLAWGGAIGRTPRSIDHAHQSLRNYAACHLQRTRYWERFRQTLSYSKVNLPQPETYQNLKDDLDALDQRLTATVSTICQSRRNSTRTSSCNLGALGIWRVKTAESRACASRAWRRVVIEKPFGYNLDTAKSLNRAVHSLSSMNRRYIGSTTIWARKQRRTSSFMRFANTIFEPVWNRSHISNVQVTVAETVDVGTRAGYYDGSGVMRDMMQNHLLQLLSLIAMEPPSAFDADALRNEKVKVLQAARAVQTRRHRARTVRWLPLR